MFAIAIFRTGSFGEVVLASVAINILQDVVPGAHIHWFGKSATLGFIKDAFPASHVHEIKPGAGYKANIKIVKEASQSFDIIIDLQRSLRTIILGKLAAAHFSCPYITWNKYSIHRSLLVLQSRIRGRASGADLMPVPLTNRYAAMANCTQKALLKIGIQIPEHIVSYKPYINTGHSPIPKTIAINLGALYAGKELPLYKLKEILSYTVNNNIAETVYFLGDESKYTNAEILAGQHKGSIHFYNLCGKTTLWQAACILATCTFSISNDTALAHLSECVNTPVLMFFGPTHEKFGYRPHLQNSKSFSANISCRPCTKGGNTNCRYKDFKCLHDINLLPVFDHISYLNTIYS